MKNKSNFRWAIRTALFSFVMTVVFSFVSERVLEGANYIAAFLVLAFFIGIGILFDMIGVAVTSASPVPFHAMASHKEKGAAEALWLLDHAEKVASFCNDVIGDISGIVSGATAAVIAANLIEDLSFGNIVIQLIISGVVAAFTIGGKAMGKAGAMKNSTKIVLIAARVMHIKTRVKAWFGKKRRKRK